MHGTFDGRVRVNRPHPAIDPRALAIVGVGLAGVAALAGVERLEGGRRHRSFADALVEVLPLSPRQADPGLDRRAARKLHASAAMLAGSVLADSAVEHYRGSYKNPAMYTPLVASALTLLASLEGLSSGARPLRRVRDGVYALAAAVGGVGLGFHLFNIGKRPGGYNWLNLFYAAPAGAPAAISLAGLIGYAAERLHQAAPTRPRRLFGFPFARALAGITGAGIAGTVGEAGLLHFRGAFQNPFMWLPVSLPPVAAALMGRAAATPTDDRHWLTRAWLWATAVLGVAGVGFHAYGVSRAMGGWRNWSQNVVDGPPLPAPPSFSALALAGLAALDLLEGEDRRARR